MRDALVEVKDLKKYFNVKSSSFSRKNALVHAVDNVSFNIYDKETLGLVGESGCGKSTLGKLLINLLNPTDGEVYFKNKNIFGLENKEMKDLRKEMQIIFQDPYASLNPRMRIADIIGEPLITHCLLNKKEKEDRIKELINLVGLRNDYMRRFPHQMSGGQRQRVGIARALALNPKFIVCDEAVSALDVSIQSQILNLLKELQGKLNLTYLFISHDLSVVKYISDRVCVMFLGKIVELGTTDEIFEKPMHPYTKFLISALPLPDPHMRERERFILEGDIPSPINPPSGCRFHTRCPYCKDICKEKEPELLDVEGHRVACHFPLSN